MKIFSRFQNWLRSLYGDAEPSQIECSYCGASILIPSLGINFERYITDRIHVIAPGSIIPCPKCGKNLAEFLLTRKLKSTSFKRD